MANEWEDAPAVWEDTPSEQDILEKQVGSLGNIAKGVGTAAVDLVGGIPGFIAGTGAGVATAIGHQDPTGGLELAKEVMGKSLPSHALGINVEGNKGYEYAMKPIEWFNELLGFSAKGYGEIAKALDASEETVKSVSSAAELSLLAGMVGAGGKASRMKQKGEPVPKKGPDLKGIEEDLSSSSSSAVDRPQPKIDINLSRLEERAPLRPGDEPIFVDPQGQAFRGHPDEANARLALERQTEALDTALEHPKTLPPKGEPLELLQKRQLEASNEGPQMPLGEAAVQHQLRGELAEKARSDHPFVRKAEERVQKQEELVTKLSEQVEKGKATASALAREVKNLENFEAALERTKLNISEGMSANKKPVPFDFKRQGGAINPEVFKEGFEKVVEGVRGVTYHVRSRPDARGILPMVVVEARKGKEKIGEYSFYTKENDLVAAGAETKAEYRRQGIASGAYEAIASLGNDIVPSGLQTKEGKAMWKGFQEWGLASAHGRGYIPKKQRGAVLIDPDQAPQGKFLSDQPHLKLPTIVPMKRSAEQVIEMARGAADVDQNFLQKGINYFTKGGIYQALKTDNPVIKFAVEQIHAQERKARGEIESEVHGKLVSASQALTKTEKGQIWAVINLADSLERSVTPEQLAARGFNEKQIHFFNTHREVMDLSFERLNQARLAAGKKPVKKREAYAAMSMTGDYRKLVYKLDEAGEKKIVGVIGSDLRAKLNFRAKKLEEAGYTVGEERYFGGVPRQKGSAQSAFMDALEFLAENDPNVATLLKTFDDINRQEAYSFLNMKKHTMQKKGVFGMEGRKEWLSPEQNAKEGIQSQINYAEQAIKWGHVSEAAREVRKVLSSENVKHMPEAKRWSEEYVQNAMGFNPSQMGRLLEQGVAAGMGFTGMGYSNVRNTMAMSRKVANTVLLGLNPGFWLTNVVQPLHAMPGMKAYLISKGLDATFDFGTGHYYLFNGTKTAFRENGHGQLTAFERGLVEYAKNNHVYGSDLIEHSNRASKDATYLVDKAGNLVAGRIESVSRRVVFFSMAHMLRENGLSVKNGLYEAAHNLTDMAMNNYSPTERPKMYNSMGPLGDLATNLSSYKHNEFSRLALFARQIKEEKTMRPLGAQLATGVAMAGLTGTIMFAEADGLYKEITKALGKPDSLTALVLRMSEDSSKAMGLDNKYALSHGGFSFLGLDMSKRLGLQEGIPNTIGEAVFPGGSKLVEMAGAGYEAVRHPSEMNTKRAIREASPGIATGIMDRAWFSKDTPKGELAANRETLEGQVYRNTADKFWKTLGMTGVNESVQKSKLFETKHIKQAYADKRQPALKQARDELFTKGNVSQETVDNYLKHDGDVNTLLADLARMRREQNIPAKDLELLRASMSRSITSLRHARRLREAYENK
jgi:hypothetical protein